MKIQIKKTNEKAVIPAYATKLDAGLDLTAVSKTIVNEGEYGYIEYGTGLSVAIPEGFYGQIVPRSSISKTGMILANSPGTIDAGYRGEVMLRFKAIKDTKQYEVGDRIAQLIVLPFPNIEFEEVEELDKTDRQDGGFGSSGN